MKSVPFLARIFLLIWFNKIIKMDIKRLKISLVQKILSTNDIKLLEKHKSILEKENIIGYDAKGNPVTESQYITEMDNILFEIDNGTANLFTTGEVINQIEFENDII